MEYSPNNLAVWGIFVAFAISVWVIARLFRSRHPDYPGDLPDKLE
jgi:hypothetical protein